MPFMDELRKITPRTIQKVQFIGLTVNQLWWSKYMLKPGMTKGDAILYAIGSVYGGYSAYKVRKVRC
jgi:hypothetical protein